MNTTHSLRTSDHSLRAQLLIIDHCLCIERALEKWEIAPWGPKWLPSCQIQCPFRALNFSSWHYCPLPPDCLQVCIASRWDLLLFHPGFSWLAICLLSLIHVSSPNYSQAPRLDSPTLFSHLLWDALTLPDGSNHPSQAGNISSHLSSPLPVGQQPSMSNHPQPGPSSLFLPQGFQGSPSPQLHLGYFLVIILTAMQASTPRRHHVLRIHSHLAPYFQSQNFECPAVSATGPGHLFELLPYSPAWLSRCLAGPHSLPCATFHSLPEPCLSSCQVPTHQGEKPIAT